MITEEIASEGRRVRVVEVGPRDGLQNSAQRLTVEQRVELIERLVAAGVRDIEVGSFVHPRWIPQMAQTDEVFARLERRAGVRYWALVPNMRGLETARSVGVEHVAVFLSTSETHNQRNLNRSIAESLANVSDVARACRAEGIAVRGYLSTVFGCPFEGAVPVERVIELAQALLELGAEHVALGDTTGMGEPAAVERKLVRLVEAIGAERLALHSHDTRGVALVNTTLALRAGLRIFDSSIGGLGGCPYAPGAAGNLASEDLVHLLSGLDLDSEVDLEALVETSAGLESLGFPIASTYYRYGRSLARELEPASGSAQCSVRSTRDDEAA